MLRRSAVSPAAPVPRRAESVHEIEEGVRGTDVRVVQHIVCHQIAGVQPFLVEPVETDASASARQVAQHAAVPDEGFHVDDGVDAATAGTPQKQQRVPRVTGRNVRQG